jgi:preprotein translocase subunit SecB
VGHREEAYDAFLRGIELFALGMDSVEAKLKRAEYSAAHADESTKIEKTVESTFSLSDLAEDFFDISADFVFTMQAEGQEPFLRIAVAYEAHFHWNQSVASQNEVERFAQSEARLIFWPYFRQAVSDISARMHIRQVTVPLTLRFEDSE